MRLPVVVLCGGRGTRAHPLTEDVPKPLLPVGDRPVLGHVLEVFARQGHRRFVLAAGFRADAVRAYAATLPWDVDVVDSGVDTGTAERLRRCAPLVGDRFVATYGDGVGDVDLGALQATHAAHGACATVTTVPLRSPYGTVESDAAGRVTAFREKPLLPEHRVNAGFLVLERAALDLATGADLERELLPALAAAGELYVYRHDGYWMSVDTQKDLLEMRRLAEGEDAAPWLTCPVPASSSPARRASSAPT